MGTKHRFSLTSSPKVDRRTSKPKTTAHSTHRRIHFTSENGSFLWRSIICNYPGRVSQRPSGRIPTCCSWWSVLGQWFL